MGYSQASKARSREKIITAAATRIRDHGLFGFSIADVMNDAKLTHGGFYIHFESREQLLAEALQRALQESSVVYATDREQSLTQIITDYLSRTHRDRPSRGCAVAALGSEVARTAGTVRDVMSVHLQKYFTKISELLSAATGTKPAAGRIWHELTIPIVCILNGALTLSRLIDDRALSDRVLAQAREYLLQLVNAATQRTRAARRGRAR